MNKQLYNQLKQCKINLPDFDENTTHLIIPKQTQINTEIQLERDKYYLIKLARYILNPPEHFNLDSNWNKGVHPKSEYMLVTPIKFAGKMTCFDGCGYDYNAKTSLPDVYSELWLPSKGIEIIDILKN